MKTKQQRISCSVLIVDDSELMRKILGSILEIIGYKVVAEAKNGFEAVAKYSEFNPDLVLMDVFMPDKDGLEATAEILSINSHAKIILCSTLDEKALAAAAIKLGAIDVIFKPYNINDISDRLDKVIQM
jgi:two-component system, chemotaxis family, chemotaxis protein CheY